MTQITWLSAEQPASFPPTSLALEEPNGLLAVGGALSPNWLLTAYQRGIFPWFSEGEPIFWWSPAPRMVLTPGQAHISRSLRKQFKKLNIRLTINGRFDEVVRLCADSPTREGGTWITKEMQQAYLTLHKKGFAHSIEVIEDGHLVGGLYGVCIGSVFFGESMFSLKSSASKYAFIGLSELAREAGIDMIDCQLYNPYLDSLGATLVSREFFEKKLPPAISVTKLGTNERITSLLTNILSQKTNDSA